MPEWTACVHSISRPANFCRRRYLQPRRDLRRVKYAEHQQSVYNFIDSGQAIWEIPEDSVHKYNFSRSEQMPCLQTPAFHPAAAWISIAS